MTIVDKTEPSDPSSCQNQPGSSEAVSPEDMDTGSASWGAVSSISDVSNHTLSLGPVPGAVVYSNSSVPDKSKPSPPKDQGMTAELLRGLLCKCFRRAVLFKSGTISFSSNEHSFFIHPHPTINMYHK